MTKDPVVEEVRTIRDEIAKEHGYNLDSIFEELQHRDATQPGRHLSLAPRPYPSSNKLQ